MEQRDRDDSSAACLLPKWPFTKLFFHKIADVSSDNTCFAGIHIKAAVPEGPAGKLWAKQHPSIWGCSSRVLTGDGRAETGTASLDPPGTAWLQPRPPHSFNSPTAPSCLTLGQHHPKPPAAWGLFPFPFPPVPSDVTIAQMLWDLCECSWGWKGKPHFPHLVNRTAVSAPHQAQPRRILVYAYGTCPKSRSYLTCSANQDLSIWFLLCEELFFKYICNSLISTSVTELPPWFNHFPQNSLKSKMLWIVYSLLDYLLQSHTS